MEGPLSAALEVSRGPMPLCLASGWTFSPAARAEALTGLAPAPPNECFGLYGRSGLWGCAGL